MALSSGISSTPRPRVLVFGHSFVSRLREFLVTSQHDETFDSDLNLSRECEVTMRQLYSSTGNCINLLNKCLEDTRKITCRKRKGKTKKIRLIVNQFYEICVIYDQSDPKADIDFYLLSRERKELKLY